MLNVQTSSLQELAKVGLSNLVEVKSSLEQQLSQINLAINALKGERETNVSWTVRAINCVRQKQRPVLQKEILECLFWNEQEKLADKERRKNYSIALSGALTNLVKKELLIRFYIPGVKGYYYAVPEWCNKAKDYYELKSKYQQKLNEILYEEDIA